MLKQELRTNNLEAYEVWYASNDCNLIFNGSVPKMEGIGAKYIFDCSITKSFMMLFTMTCF